jgi:hypothetical protein
MRSVLTILVLLAVEEASTAETNVLLEFHAEKRAGARIFVDECLARGLTNSMPMPDLRRWATNTLQRYRRLESVLATNSGPDAKRFKSVQKSDIPEAILSLHSRIPSCKFSYSDSTNRFFTIGPDPDPPRVGFFRDASGDIEAIRFDWYIYGIVVGDESFRTDWDPWYKRKLTEGVYLWHGYK